MAKKKKSFTEESLELSQGLTIGGMGLSLGSTIIGKLPASAAQAGVQTGLGTAGKFYPTIATVGIAGLTLKQLKKLKKK